MSLSQSVRRGGGTLLALLVLGGAAAMLSDDLRGRAIDFGRQHGLLPKAEGGADKAASGADARNSRPTGGGRPGAGAAVAVTVMEVQPHPSKIRFEGVGIVQPLATVAIKSRLDSQVVEVGVEEGAKVKAGDLLLRLDDRTLRAQLAQIEGQIAKDDAQVEQAMRDLARFEDLLERKIGTQVQRDTAATTLAGLKAQREADFAQKRNIETQIGFTEIRAPIAGRIGSITAKMGAVVRAADTTPLMTINQIEPIYIAVGVPQPLVADLREAMLKGEVPVSAVSGSATETGTVAFIENTIDPATGTLIAKAKMGNARETLWPGAFVRATVTLGVDPQALTVPLAAVQNGQDGHYVFIADETGRARQVKVEVARGDGDDVVIRKGLNPGDRVVTSGQLRIINGTPIQPRGAGNGASPSPGAGKRPRNGEADANRPAPGGRQG